MKGFKKDMGSALKRLAKSGQLLVYAFFIFLASLSLSQATWATGPDDADFLCELMVSPPPLAHPLRKEKIFVAAFRALDGEAFEKAYADFQKALAIPFRESRRSFDARRFSSDEGGSSKDGTAKAAAFLERWVFQPNAPIRLGKDGFEPSFELQRTMLYAACKGGLMKEAIALAKAVDGGGNPEFSSYAAALLVKKGDMQAARTLKSMLGRDFLSHWVLSVLEDNPELKELERQEALKLIQSDEERRLWKGQ